jgi:predicted permease
MLSDFRYAFRQLAKSPGFTAVAVLTLALGLSVNTVFFTIGNDLFLRPLPATEPDRLVVAAVKSPVNPFQVPFSYPDVQDLRKLLETIHSDAPDLARAYSDLMAYKEQAVHLSRAGESTERAYVHAATENYFSMLGVQPHLGRFFLPAEGRTIGADPIIVLSHATWTQRFGANPAIVGQTVKLNGHPFTVVGVAPQGFFGAAWGTTINGFIPITMLPKIQPGDPLQRGSTCAFIMGRLTPGTGVAQANAALNVAFAQVMKLHPGNYLKNSYTVVMRENASRPSPYIAHYAPMIMAALSALALLVLTVAIANVANLLFARATNRNRELAIRSALGASRVQLIRGLIAESTLLALAAGVVGAIAALWLTPLLLNAAPGNPSGFAPAAETGNDWRPFLFTTITALLVGIATGILPALKASGGTPFSSLKDSGISNTGRRHVWRSLLVVGQVAMSCLVLICATMALRSFVLLSKIPAGFSVENRTIGSFNLDLQNYTKEQGRLFHARLLERLRSLPVVQSASLATCMPLEPATPQNGGITAAGAPKEVAQSTPPVFTIRAEHDFFQTLGMRIESGRGFTAQDRFGSPLVAVINQACARLLFPGQDPVGRRISFQGDYETEVIGVLAPTRFYNLTSPDSPLLFLSLEQKYRGDTSVIVHARDFAGPLGPLITKTVHELDPDLPVYDIRTLAQQVDVSVNGLSAWHSGAIMASVQGAIALLLAGAGIFGLVAFTVTQRTREIGIRVALGASRFDVIRSVAMDSIVLTLIGVAIGVVLWFGLSQVLSRLLIGSGLTDILIVGGIALLVLSAALAASWLPIRRALRVNPVVALRAE